MDTPPLILLVEDDDELAALVTSGLLRHGYRVKRSANGREALQAFDQERPEVVVTDLVMPEKEGWSLIAELRRRPHKVPIVAMSGGGLDTARTYLNLAQHLGAEAVLPKPFTVDQLLKILRERLKVHPLESA